VDLLRIATIPKGHVQFSEGLPVSDADHAGRREVYFTQSKPPFSGNIWEHWGSNSCQDGLSDLLCAWGPQAFLLESLTPAKFPSETVWAEPLGGFPGMRSFFVDADRDGQQEMWIVPNSPNQIEVWETWGDSAYVRVSLLAEPLLDPNTLAFGDFDGDGATEIVAAGALYGLFVWENAGR
jgi:hypothetical protein